MQEQETQSQNSYASIEAVPASVVKAICQVQKTFEHAVPKRGRNEFAKFSFVSVDDIYGTLSGRMAQAGLTLLTFEESATEDRVQVNSKTALFVTFKFRAVLATEDATWAPAQFCRTLRVRIEGPQSYAAAQSFFEKAIMRSVFKLPTGDTELDQVKQAETLEDQVDEQPVTRKRKSSASAKRDGDDAKFNALKRQISTCRDSQTLQDIYKEHVVEDRPFGDYPTAWAEMLTDEYSIRLQDLTTNGA